MKLYFRYILRVVVKKYRLIGAMVMLFILSIALFAGINVNAQSVDQIETIKVDTRKSNYISWDDFAKDISVIKLENPEDVIVGRVSKIRISKKRILIMNGRAKTIFCFSDKGKYLFSLKASGEGPGEFNRLEDFEIDEKNQLIHIYDDIAQKMVSFSLVDGSFKFEKRLSLLFGSQFTYLNGKYIFFKRFESSEPYENKIVYFDENLQEQKRTLPFKKRALTDAYIPGLFTKYGSMRRFTIGQNDTIFSASSLGVSAVYYVDFGKFKVGGKYHKATTGRDGISALVNSNYAGKKTALVETDEWFGFSFAKYNDVGRKKGVWRHALYSKREKRVVFNLKGISIPKSEAVIRYPITVSGDNLVTIVDFYSLFKNSEKDLSNRNREGVSEGYGSIQGVDQVLKEVRMDDNPYLIFFKPNLR